MPFSEKSGYNISALTEREFEALGAEKAVLIGNVKNTFGMDIPSDISTVSSYILSNDKAVWINGSGSVGLFNAVKTFENTLKYSETEKIIMENTKGKIENEMIKAMSYNVYIGNQTDERHDRVGDMIEKYMPDVLGVQEADIRWMKYISNRFPMYAYAGEGRDGGEKGEYSAVFYRKDKFKLTESATKWLSDSPDVVSKVPESTLNRVFSYAVLERISDGKVFVHVNTHFEHTTDISREKQAEVLAGFLKTFEYPILLTGDFNTTADTKAYSTVVNAGVTDSMSVSDKVESSATFHGYNGSNSTIDFCFVTPDTIAVNKYRACTDKIGGDYPSDHHPVYIEFVM